MSEIRTVEIIQRELHLARERVSELEREIHRLAIGAYVAFLQLDSNRYGVIAVADKRADLPTREYDFTCRIAEDCVFISMHRNASRRNMLHDEAGEYVPIDAGEFEFSAMDLGVDDMDIRCRSLGSTCYLLTAFSSRDHAEAWLKEVMRVRSIS